METARWTAVETVVETVKMVEIVKLVKLLRPSPGQVLCERRGDAKVFVLIFQSSNTSHDDVTFEFSSRGLRRDNSINATALEFAMAPPRLARAILMQNASVGVEVSRAVPGLIAAFEKVKGEHAAESLVEEHVLSSTSNRFGEDVFWCWKAAALCAHIFKQLCEFKHNIVDNFHHWKTEPAPKQSARLNFQDCDVIPKNKRHLGPSKPKKPCERLVLHQQRSVTTQLRTRSTPIQCLAATGKDQPGKLTVHVGAGGDWNILLCDFSASIWGEGHGDLPCSMLPPRP